MDGPSSNLPICERASARCAGTSFMAFSRRLLNGPKVNGTTMSSYEIRCNYFREPERGVPTIGESKTCSKFCNDFSCRAANCMPNDKQNDREASAKTRAVLTVSH